LAWQLHSCWKNHFIALVDKEFTAKMENELDAISRGELDPFTFYEKFLFWR
jgi:Topoisomerase IA